MKRLFAFALAAMVLLALPAAARYGLKKSIFVGATSAQPTYLAYNSQGNKVYASCPGISGNFVAVIDADRESLLTQVTINGPGEMIYAPGLDRIFVHDNDMTLYAISGLGDTVVGSASTMQGGVDIAYNAGQNKVYSNSSLFGGMNIYNGSSLAFLGSVNEIYGNLFYCDSLQKLYGVNTLGKIYVVDGVTDAIIDSITQVGIDLTSLMEYNPAAQKLYITMPGQSEVCVVNATTDNIITVLMIGAPVMGLAYCPVNNAVYASDANGTITGIFSDESTSSYNVGMQLTDIAYNKTDSLLYTTTYAPAKASYMMMFYDPMTNAMRDSVFLGGSGQYPHLAVDNQGDVYASDLFSDEVHTVGRVPNTAWRSNPMSGGYGSWYNGFDWEVYDTLLGWIQNPQSTVYPSAADSSIVIQAGDTISSDGTLAVDELTIDGVFLHTGGTVSVNDGPGVDVTVNGTFSQGTSTFYDQLPGSQWVYAANSKHEFMGGDIDPLPIATWDSTSLLHVLSVDVAMSFANGSSGQQFGDILWSAGTMGTFTLAADSGFGCRDLQIDTGYIALCSDSWRKVTVRNYTQNNGYIYVKMVPGGELEVRGDFTMNNGTFQMGGAGGGDTLRLRGSCYHNGGYLYGYLMSRSANIIFAGSGQQSYVFNELLAHTQELVDFSALPGSYLFVGGTLGAGNNGTFTLSPGAFLGTSDTLGMWLTADAGCIRNTGTRTYGPNAGFIFSEGPSSGITGDAVAGAVSMISAGNSRGTTLTASVNVSDSLVLMGPLATGADTIFMPSGAPVAVAGGYVQGNLAKSFQVGTGSGFFEVGTPVGQYSPVGLQLYNATTPGYITVSALASPHPQADSLSNCLKRYWRISGPGIFCDNSEITLNYLPGDFTATFTELDHESTMVAGRYSNGATPGWSLPAVLARLINLTNDGGAITLAGGNSFDDNPEFTTGRDAASIHTFPDIIPPAAPESLQIYGYNPSYWLSRGNTSVPVGWMNPYDSSGIARAYYKVGSAPTDTFDCTDTILVVGGVRDTFFLAVDTLNGILPVYVWLQDSAGNASHLNTASVVARRDTVPPAGAAVKPFTADTNYTTNFTVNWSQGTDGLSGLQAWRVLYQVDTVGALWDTLAPFTVDTTAMFSGALPGHRYYFEAAAMDSALNWEAFTGTAEESIYVSPGDITPPGPPDSLLVNGADPMPWTNKDSLNLSWTNPEPSIGAGYYKIGAAPSSNFDTTGHLTTLGGSATISYPGLGPAPIFLWLADSLGNTLYLNSDSATIRADKTPPFNVTVNPFTPDTVTATTFTVSWTAGNDTISGIRHYQLRYSVDSPSVWLPWADSLATTSTSFTGAFGHRYYFEANGTDSAGNAEAFTGTPEASVFVSFGDTTRPTILSTSPANSATGVALNATVSILFSEPIQASLFLYSISPNPGGLSAGWSPDSTLVTIGHASFAPLAACTVTVTAAPDTMGLPLLGSNSFSFTTVDTTSPTIMSTSPANGASGVAIGTPLTITFSEAMNTSAFAYTVAPNPGGLSAAWSADSLMVTVNHTAFGYQTAYTVTVDTARDAAGNLLFGPNSFSFTTGPAPDITKPWITNTSPANGELAVALTRPVVVNFSETIDTASFRFACVPNPVGWSVAWSDSDRTATLSHGDFTLNTGYTFRVDSAADAAGNQMDTTIMPSHWTFTTVGLTTLTTGWTGGIWRLFSVPLDPQDTSAMGLLGDDLGAYSDSTWRLVGYKPSYGYVERPSVAPGYGYWLASAGSATIDAQGLPLSGFQSVALDSGWNIVGDPFDTSVALATARVRWTDTIPHDLLYSDPSVNSILRQRMWYYSDATADLINNGTWDSLMPGIPSHALAPWSGYAVYAEKPCSLVVERFTKAKGWSPQPEFSIIWQLELEATMGSWVDRGLRIGASPQASTGFDRLDAEKPPLVSDRLAISLPHPDWNRGPCRNYLYDFRPPGQEHQWTIKVDADQSQPVEVAYVLAGRPEAGYHLYLINRRAGQGQEIAGAGAIGCSGNAELSVVYTTSTLDQLNMKPLAFSLNRTYPNPFTDRIDINFQVDRPGKVELAVYNVAGQRVATLIDGQRQPGFYTAGWRSSGAAAGVYFARLAACGQVQVKKMVKVR